ncbi:MAG: hypothetical protein WKG07_25775 [Hymenobacter sp.]
MAVRTDVAYHHALVVLDAKLGRDSANPAQPAQRLLPAAPLDA